MHGKWNTIMPGIDSLVEDGVREFEVGRIKRSADPAPNNDSTPSNNLCRIGVAALLDAGLLVELPVSPASQFPDTLTYLLTYLLTYCPTASLPSQTRIVPLTIVWVTFPCRVTPSRGLLLQREWN